MAIKNQGKKYFLKTQVFHYFFPLGSRKHSKNMKMSFGMHLGKKCQICLVWHLKCQTGIPDYNNRQAGLLKPENTMVRPCNFWMGRTWWKKRYLVLILLWIATNGNTFTSQRKVDPTRISDIAQNLNAPWSDTNITRTKLFYVHFKVKIHRSISIIWNNWKDHVKSSQNLNSSYPNLGEWCGVQQILPSDHLNENYCIFHCQREQATSCITDLMLFNDMYK